MTTAERIAALKAKIAAFEKAKPQGVIHLGEYVNARGVPMANVVGNRLSETHQPKVPNR